MQFFLWLVMYFGAIALFTWGFVYLDTKHTKDITWLVTKESVKAFLRGLK